MLRVGIGYDVHRLADGRKLVIGCIEIPSARGPVAHSDGDVLVHALADALLGACSLGDIGRHFPDDDPAYRNMSGLDLLARLKAKIAKVGRIEHLDSIVIIEEPRLAPHIESMRQAISGVLEIPIDKMSIKAKTAEGLGPVGSGDAVEARAVALVDL